MKMRFYTLLSVIFMTIGAFAQIVMDDPVINMDNGNPTYIKFSGTNATNNYVYTLDTYEPVKFQLILNRYNESNPAAFTVEDLSDENYWEPLFRKYTKEIAGFEMQANDNIKKLYVNNVALLSHQFEGYCSGLNDVYINASGTYTIPDSCFAKGSSEGYGIKRLDCKVKGKLKLGQGVVDHDAGGLNIYTYDGEIAQVWAAYKRNNNAAFKVFLNNEEYQGSDEDPDPDYITAVTINYTLNGVDNVLPLPDEGGKVQSDAFQSVLSFSLNGFTVQTATDVEEIFMDYVVYPEGDGGKQHNWTPIHATLTENGVWVSNQKVDVLANLESNSNYSLEFAFNTNDINNKGRKHYPTSGQTVRIEFTTGSFPEGITLQKVETTGNSNIYDVQGRRVTKQYRGTVIKNGKKMLKP